MLRESVSFIELLFCSVLYAFLLYFSYKNRIVNKRVANIALSIGVMILCVFSFWGGDYYHYMEAFASYKTSKDIYHIEEAYLPIFQISPNYMVFRLIIWGCGLALLFFSRKLLKIEVSLFLFSFVFLYLFRFSYARVSLSLAMIIFAYSIIISRSKIRILPLLTAVVITYFAIPFHKSSALAVVGIIIGLLCSKRKTLVFLLLVSPIVIRWANLYLYNYIIDNSLIEDELTLNAFNLYTQRDDAGGTVGLGALVFRVLEIGSVFYWLILLFYFIHIKKIETSRSSILMFSACAGFVFLAMCFAFTTPVIFRRVLYMSMAPMMLSLAMVYDKVKETMGVRLGLIIMVLYQSYNILYNYRTIGIL